MEEFFKNEKIKKLSLYNTIHLFHNYNLLEYSSIDELIEEELLDNSNDDQKYNDIDSDDCFSMLVLSVLRFQEQEIILPWEGLKYENIFMDFDTFSKTKEYKIIKDTLDRCLSNGRDWWFAKKLVECIRVAQYYYRNEPLNYSVDLLEDCKNLSAVFQAFLSKFDIYFSYIDKDEDDFYEFYYDDDIVEYWNKNKETLMDIDGLENLKNTIYFSRRQFVIPGINKENNRLIRYRVTDEDDIDFDENNDINDIYIFGEYALIDCCAKKIILPNTLMYIGKYTFAGCNNTEIDFSKITKSGKFYDSGIDDVLNYKEFKEHLLNHDWKQMD